MGNRYVGKGTSSSSVSWDGSTMISCYCQRKQVAVHPAVLPPSHHLLTVGFGSSETSLFTLQSPERHALSTPRPTQQLPPLSPTHDQRRAHRRRSSCAAATARPYYNEFAGK
jgi:hypothetical protein